MNKTYEAETARTALARQLAAEAMVLLKNEGGLLPLPKGKTVALLGQTQLDTVIGGGGSGASFSEGTLQIRDELRQIICKISQKCLLLCQPHMASSPLLPLIMFQQTIQRDVHIVR